LSQLYSELIELRILESVSPVTKCSV